MVGTDAQILFQLQSSDFGGAIFIPFILLAGRWAERDEFRKYEQTRLAYAKERLRRIHNLEI